jgi:hypothetical protein
MLTTGQLAPDGPSPPPLSKMSERVQSLKTKLKMLFRMGASIAD